MLGEKKEKLNRTSKFFPPSLCRASSDIIPSSQIRSILFTLPLSLPLSRSTRKFFSRNFVEKMDTLAVVNAVLLAFSSYLCHRAYILPSKFHRLSDRAGKWRVRQLSASSLWSTRVTPNRVAENVNFSHQDPKCIPRRNIIFTPVKIRFQHGRNRATRENSFSKLQYFDNSVHDYAYMLFQRRSRAYISNLQTYSNDDTK